MAYVKKKKNLNLKKASQAAARVDLWGQMEHNSSVHTLTYNWTDKESKISPGYLYSVCAFSDFSHQKAKPCTLSHPHSSYKTMPFTLAYKAVITKLILVFFFNKHINIKSHFVHLAGHNSCQQMD